MIKPGEIQRKANAFGIRDQQIEKDYILSWILLGISKHKQLSSIIIFKGGTVLKKAYFENYRFSEDLDFTLLDDNIINSLIFSWFNEVFDFIKSEANIPLSIIDNNEHEDGGINFYISYIGPLGGQGNNKRVKVDISRNEKMVFNPVLNEIIIQYTDLHKHQLLCYSLEEVLVEKMRSVMQRMQARDLYDLWYLLENNRIDPSLYINEFIRKCSHKNLQHTDFSEKLIERIPQYKARWEKSLKDQIKDLPEFDLVQRGIFRHLKNLS